MTHLLSTMQKQYDDAISFILDDQEMKAYG